jgi:two-component system, sensor histidine kinase and response regulator
VESTHPPAAAPTESKTKREVTSKPFVTPAQLLESVLDALDALGIGFEIKQPAQLPEYQSTYLKKLICSENEGVCHQRYLGQDSACRPCLLARAIKTGELQRATLESSDGHYFDVTAIPQQGIGQGHQWAMEVLQDVTERTWAEKALRASRERFRVIAENSPDVISRFDREYRYLYISPNIFERTGKLPENIVGKKLDEVGIPPDICQIMTAEIDAVFGTGETGHVQVQWHNGTWIDWLFVAERNETGEARAVIAFARDISQIKKNEAELLQRQARLENAQALADTGDFSVDIGTNHVTWSKQLFRIHGLDPEKDTPNTESFLGLMLPTYTESVLQHVAAAGTTGVTQKFEYRIMRPDGTARALAASIGSKSDENGELVTLFGSVQDVTEQVLAADALRKSEELYRMIADNVGDGIWLVELHTLRFIYTSPAVVQASGYSAEELADLSLDELITQDSLSRLQGVLSQALPLAKTDRNITRRLEVEQRTKSGSARWVEMTVRLLFDAAGSPREIIGVTHDVTERRNAHELLTKAKFHAEEVSRLKSHFVSNVSHEMRTPLNAIIGLSELMLRDGDLESVQARASVVLHESELLLSLVNDLLDQAKMEQGKLELCPEPTRVRELLEAVERTASIAATSKALPFRLSVDPSVPDVIACDELRLRQVLQNLVGNAVKFTDHGEVRLEVSCSEQNANSARLIFSVVDTGIGIAEERQAAIFDPFVQADVNTTRRFGGTGLGTTIARELVRMMGGDIKITSALEHGSRFWFELTFELPNPSTTVQPQSRSVLGLDNPQSRRSASILVAEDYPINHRILREHLESAGHQVTVVEQGDAAVHACSERRFDLVLMDLQMPVMDGFEATQRIRALPGHLGKVPILATTASAEASTRRECLAWGMNGVVTKPVRRQAILETVENWLAHSAGEIDTPMPPSIARAPQQDDPVSRQAAFNYQGLLEQFGGKETLARSVAREFTHNLEQELADLAALSKAFDFERLRQRAHRLKGGAASICATAVSELAAELEVLARNADMVPVPQLLNKLQEARLSLAKMVSAIC